MKKRFQEENDMDELLKLLSSNSKFTTEELSMILDEPVDYLEKQIAEYEATGVIKGYHAIVDWDKVPHADVKAMIEIKVTPEKDKGFDDIAAKIMSFEEVESLYLMAGSYDFAAYVTGRTMQEVAMFVSRRLSTIESVIATSTHFLLKKYKESGINFYEDDSEEDKRSLVL